MLLEALAARAKVPVDVLEGLAASASKRYKVYPIPKRDGSMRLISHPSRSLKAIQRWLSRNLLQNAPVHSAATAYEKGQSIRENALRHAGSSFTTRLDFKDFFPSFNSSSVRMFLDDLNADCSLGLPSSDIIFATRIFCKGSALAIGAPSSPKLTNAMMFKFDRNIYEYSQGRGVIYTRYADDLYISAFNSECIRDVEEYIRNVVSNHDCPKLFLKEEKTLHLSKRGHRSVTGLVITPSGKVSLGRQRKREIKTLVYKALQNSLNPVERGRLAGLIAFAHDIEPNFIGSLSQKFEINMLSWIKEL